MAFNVAVFKTRTLTAVVFVAVMLVGLLWNHWSFFILFSIIHFGCWIEYQKLVALIDPGYKNISLVHKYGVMIAGWALMWYFSNYDLNNFKSASILWGWPILFIIVIPIIDSIFGKQGPIKNSAHSLMGLIYISLSMGLMVSLYGYPISIYSKEGFMDGLPTASEKWTVYWSLPLMLIAAIWINDTMAYIVGSFIGKTPLSKISPKKTWEGTLGGIILAMATLGIIAWANNYKVVPVIITVAIAAITGTFGDLFESKLKRLAGVKDSGTFMPGHGGFLDRFDSLLVAIPFVWLYVVLFLI